MSINNISTQSTYASVLQQKQQRPHRANFLGFWDEIFTPSKSPNFFATIMF